VIHSGARRCLVVTKKERTFLSAVQNVLYGFDINKICIKYVCGLPSYLIWTSILLSFTCMKAFFSHFAFADGALAKLLTFFTVATTLPRSRS
jgi:hypothetical protein